MKKLNLRLLCVVFLALDMLLALLLFVSITESSRNISHRRDVLAQTMGLTENMSAEQREARLAETAGEAARYVTLRSEARAEDGAVPIYLSNGDESPCKVSIELIDYSTGETIAQSGLIEPGWRLEWLKLEKIPDLGQHHCLVRCSFYTLEEELFVGTAAKQMLLEVQ